MKKSSPRLLLFLINLLFIGAPFAVFQFNQTNNERLRLERVVEEKKETARKLLKEMKFSCSWDYQLKEALTEFHDAVFQVFKTTPDSEKSAVIGKLYENRLKTLIPPHDIIVLEKGEESGYRKIFQNSIRKFFNPEFEEAFERSMDADFLKPNPWFSNFSAVFRKTLNYPVYPGIFCYQQTTLREKKEGGLLLLGENTGTKGIFWYFPSTGFPRLLLAVILDLEKINFKFGMEYFISGFKDRDVGVAFLPDLREKGMRSSEYFSGKNDLLEGITRSISDLQGLEFEKTIGDQFFCAAPVLFGLPYFAVTAVTIPSKVPSTGEENLVFFLMALGICSMIGLVGRKIFFGDGPRFSVEIATFLVFCLVAIIPLMGGKILFRRVMDDKSKTDRQEAAKILHREIERLDGTFLLHGSDFLYRIKNLSKSKKIESRLLDDPKKINKKALMDEIYEEVFPLYPFRLRPSLKVSAVVGPRFKAGSVHQDNESMVTREKLERASEMAADIFPPLLVKVLPRLSPAAPKEEKGLEREDGKIAMGDIKSELKDDFTYSLLSGVLGEDAFYSFLANPDSLVIAKTSHVGAYLTTSPLLQGGKEKFLGLLVWANVNPEVNLLKSFIGSGSFKSDPHVEMLGFRRIDFKSDIQKKAQFEIPPQLWGQVDRTRRTEIPQTVEITASPGFLMETAPGNVYSAYIFSGIYDLSEIVQDRIFMETIFSAFVAGSFAVVLLIAYLAYLYFISPLRDLGEGIKEVDVRNFEIRLDEERGDEFGNLAKAFNVMTKGLKEGSLLGKYVSSVVMNTLKNKAAFEKALAGEDREMTILFSCLHGFDEFRKSRPPKEVFGILGKHLEGCSTGAKKFGGVIDKVIGDKVMMFFDHERLGGGEKTMNAVLNVVSEIRAGMKGSPLYPLIGVNSGMVIAGILGSKEVHLDYTVIGDAVNLAARLTAMAHDVGGSHVVISGNCRKFLAPEVILARIAKTHVKGKTQEIEAFLLQDFRSL